MSTSNVLAPLDYIVLAAALLFSLGVGIYHGLIGKRKSNHEHKGDQVQGDSQAQSADELGGRGVHEYFLANRTMSLLPVAISFFATSCSTLSIIGPAMEVYAFGLIFFWSAFTSIPIALLTAKLFVPLFYNMRSINIFKFIELRYNRRMKKIITILVTLRSIMMGSAIIYGTSVAFSQVTNVNVWVLIGTITGVCVIYTTLGGIRGVMWVDVFQGILMLSSAVIVIVVGTYKFGGLANIWKSNYDTGRLDIFVFDLNLTTRHTVWSDVVGLFVAQIAHVVTSQEIIHRFLTAPSLDIAKSSSYLGCFMSSCLIIFSAFIGCIMYAEFQNCDPLTSKSIQNMNQLVPTFVSIILGPYPILPGLFFAGLLSACLSTLSSLFNSLAAILMETFIQPRFPKMSDKHATNICRLLAIFVALLNTTCVLVSENFPNVVQAGYSSAASLDGPLFGMFLVGIFAPQANFKVVVTAFIGGAFTTLWIVAGGLIVKQPLKMKPMFTDGCLNESLNGANYANISQFTYYSFENNTSSIPESDSTEWAKYFPFHGITFQWLTLVGLLVFSLLFALLSAILGKDEKSKLMFDPLDFIPKKVQRFQQRLPKTLRRLFLCDVYDGSSVPEKAVICLKPTETDHVGPIANN